MPSSTPKNSRDKRLHLVYFTDASQTKSTSVSIRNLIFSCVAVVALFSTAVFCIILYSSNRALLTSKDDYIRELKSIITASAVTENKTQEPLAAEAQTQFEHMSQMASEILNPPPEASRTVAADSENTLANLQSSLSSLSTVNANLSKNEAHRAEGNINFAKGTPSGPHSDDSANGNKKSMAAKQATATKTLAQRPALNALTGIQVERRHSKELNGQTTIHFELVNTSKARGQAWAGRVCGIAELEPVSPAGGTANAGLIAVPGGKPLISAENPLNYCSDGEFVRFSRLRPTELVVPVKQDAIKRVTVFFVESVSKKTMVQQFEF